MIDLHCHILPGVDDGVASMQEALQLARDAAADGITAVAATPHVSYRYPTSADAMERSVRDVVAALQDAEIPVRVLRGGELTLESAMAMAPEQRARFGLGGRPEYVLLEFPYHGWPLDLAPFVDDLRRGGVTAVIAHPERSEDVAADPERLRPVVEAGALVQVTASSLDSRGGRTARATASFLLKAGLVHLIASDAHSPRVRRIGMTAAAQAVGDKRLAAWLTTEVPAAIVSGEPPPPRPRARMRLRRPR